MSFTPLFTPPGNAPITVPSDATMLDADMAAMSLSQKTAPKTAPMCASPTLAVKSVLGKRKLGETEFDNPRDLKIRRMYEPDTVAVSAFSMRDDHRAEFARVLDRLEHGSPPPMMA